MNKIAILFLILGTTFVMCQDENNSKNGIGEIVDENGIVKLPVNEEYTYKGLQECQSVCKCITPGQNPCHYEQQAFDRCVSMHHFEECFIYREAIKKAQNDLEDSLDIEAVEAMRGCHHKCKLEHLRDVEAKVYGECWVGCNANTISLSLLLLTIIALFLF